MRRITARIAVLLLASLAWSCSLAYDYDTLSEGEPDDTDSSSEDVEACTTAADCDDQIDCTTDQCKADGACTHIPDKSKCGYLEECDPDKGCVPSGKECRLSSDCDDEIECTLDVCADGKCRRDPDNARCVDTENLCQINRECVIGLGCTEGDTVACEQTGLEPCYEAVCDPATGECTPQLEEGADDDGDGHNDVKCGGDDCFDADGGVDIHPGANEICNLIDDDCDGLTDMHAAAGPVELLESADLSNPQVAYNGSRFAVSWQRGTDTDAEVYVQILGTGECLADQSCGITGATPATEAAEITDRAGTGSAGSEPYLVAGNELFYVTWVAADSGKSKIVVLGAEYLVDTSTLGLWSSAEQVSGDTPTEVRNPAIAWDPYAAGWIAAWISEFGDGSTTFELIDMTAHDDGNDTFAGNLLEGKMDSITLATFGPAGTALAYSFEPTEGDDDHPEVWGAHLDLDGTWNFASGWPSIISPEAPGFDEPTRQPSLTAYGDAQWAAVYSDVIKPDGWNNPEFESDIRGVLSDDPTTVVTAVEDDIVDHIHPRIAPAKNGFGLVYVQALTVGQFLDFRMLDDTLAGLPNQGARLTHVQPGKVSASQLLATEDGFALAWIENPDAGNDKLTFLAFSGCKSPK